jgi:cell division septation protein DedD
MKRLLSLAGFAVILSLIPLTSAWAVWEGNAGIGQASDFPGPGLYAKSDMFPKNTVVEIKNLETEKSVRAVVIGSSGIPGLVAVLSPETASALSIKAGSVCRVRIFIPSITERPADGTVVDGTRQTNADPDANPAAAVNQPANPEVPLETIAESPKDPLVALAPEEEAAAAPAPAAPAPAPAASDAAAPAETSSVAPAESSVPESSAATAAPAETAQAVASPAEETAPAVVVAAVPASDEEPASSVSEPAESETPEVSDTTAPTAEPELAVAGEESSSEPESEVALVPAEPLPPASPAPAQNDVPVVAENAPVPPSSAAVSSSAIPEAAPVEQPQKAVAPVESAPAPAAVVLAPAAAPAPAPAPAQNMTDVPVVNSLAKGSYYVQIGTYADMSNVKKIVDKYGSKYPFTVEKSATKNGDTLKVYVGPVKKDEYGAVLERFRQLGFKDAFVKKVP